MPSRQVADWLTVDTMAELRMIHGEQRPSLVLVPLFRLRAQLVLGGTLRAAGKARRHAGRRRGWGCDLLRPGLVWMKPRGAGRACPEITRSCRPTDELDHRGPPYRFA